MEILLEVVTLLVIGWVAGAETGSWCCVQPTVERLPYEQQMTIEKAMLRTFGRIMPILMPLSGVLAIALVITSRDNGSAVLWLRVIATICIAITVVTTLTVNLPINRLTSQWQPANDPAEWSNMRALAFLPRGTWRTVFGSIWAACRCECYPAHPPVLIADIRER